MMRKCDVLVIGGGPGGLAAASAAKNAGALSVIILERDDRAGGILNQCIHEGFGLIRYNKALTGPEYAHRAISETTETGVEILTSRHVSNIKPLEISETCHSDFRIFAYTKEGVEEYHAKTIILATGCRERTRGNISIPGSRPAGVFTAGVAQNLINVRNIMIGKKVVILGSGDIGLIMARRLTLEGAKVLAIAEIMPTPTGLARNVSQCVYEFEIPLYVNTTVSRILGKKKLEAVELSDVDENGSIIPDTNRRIDCDALVLSVGLIPENEIALTAGVKLFPDNAVETDSFLQTSVAGIFSCGNSRHVMDLADYVSEQGELAGRNAAHFMKGEQMESWDEGRTNCMKKGFPVEGSVTCTICPRGCQVRWDEVTGIVSGNQCKRGEAFADRERKDPRRTVTSTVRGNNRNTGSRGLIPVKTEKEVRKADVLKVVSIIRNMEIPGTVGINEKVGTINVDGEIIDVLTTAAF